MPSHLILVHSGTGNSLRVAGWLADRLHADGHAVGVVQVVAGQPPPTDHSDGEGLLALVFPTHGFTAPWSVLRHALSLPRSRGRPALVLATRGGTRWGPCLAPGVEGSAAVVVAAILAWKGFRICGWRGIDMPSNWTALHSALGPRSVDALRTRAKTQVDAVADRWLAGRPVMALGTVVQTALGILLAPVSLGYLLIGRQCLAKMFMPSEACDGCGVCRDRCPHAAIRWFRRRPYWTLSCESCMRCMAVCPRGAVQATQALGAAYLILAMLVSAVVIAAVRGYAPVLGDRLGTGMPSLLLHAIAVAIIVVTVYAIAWVIGRTPILGWLVHGLTLTRWYRRHLDPDARTTGLTPGRGGRR